MCGKTCAVDSQWDLHTRRTSSSHAVFFLSTMTSMTPCFKPSVCRTQVHPQSLFFILKGKSFVAYSLQFAFNYVAKQEISHTKNRKQRNHCNQLFSLTRTLGREGPHQELLRENSVPINVFLHTFPFSLLSSTFPLNMPVWSSLKYLLFIILIYYINMLWQLILIYSVWNVYFIWRSGMKNMEENQTRWTCKMVVSFIRCIRYST